MRLGEVLVGRGVITQDVLRRALDIQRRSGGPIGPLIVAIGGCAQHDVDQAWIEHVIRPALRAVVDACAGGLLERTPGIDLILTRIELTTVFFEQPGASRGLHRREAVIDGVAELRAGSAMLPVPFILDPSSHEAIIDNETQAAIAEWMCLAASRSDTPGSPADNRTESRTENRPHPKAA